MIETALAQGPEVMSFHFRLPEPDLLDRIKARGCRVICTATTPQEAVALERAGADAVIAQGQEAGGHRGSHADPGGPAALVNQIGTFALVPAIRDAVSLPVIAAGGVADGRGMAAALALGADGVQMGTAFLRCPESGVPAAHARALAAAGPGDTTVTRALSGRPARALRNALTAAFEGQEERAAPYPHQFAVTAPLREDSLARGDGDYLSLWAGQGVGLARAEPAAQVVARVAAEALAVLGRA
jgi:nitronate monooxygenase